MLHCLPPEILLHIIKYSPTANFLRNLALTCRFLNKFVEEEAWRAFVQNAFPSVKVPPYWREAAHALTTLSRNFDRRAFIAYESYPSVPVYSMLEQKVTKWKRPEGQTMGYQPVIDCYEEFTGNSMSSRREVVAWGSGAVLILKKDLMTAKHVSELRRTSKNSKKPRPEQSRAESPWVTYSEKWHVEGTDDITSVKLLRPNQKLHISDKETTEAAVIGRASGELHLVHLSSHVRHNGIVAKYETGGLAVRSADVNTDALPVIAACLGDESLVLFPALGDDQLVSSIGQSSCVSSLEPGCHTWSTQFISPDRIAVGRGISEKPILVYQVRPDGLNESPLRAFSASRTGARDVATSAYPIVGIPDVGEKELQGNVFISGCYDGMIRLHDMRSNTDYEAVISDRDDSLPIFSLLAMGRQQVVAGTGSNCLLKFFDLRMAGGRQYSYFDVAHTARANQASDLHQSLKMPSNEDICGSGWNCFAGANAISNRRYGESPIYSLASPAASSPSLYVGIENNVLHFNFTSMLDKHPDPRFNNILARTPKAQIHVKRTWSQLPGQKILNLAMYEHVGPQRWNLRKQREVGPLVDNLPTLPGYDERWYAPERRA